MQKISNTKLRKAKYSINELIKKMPPHSYKSIADTRIILHSVARELQELGYKLDNIRQLKPKHIEALVEKWKAAGQNPGTIKNKMAKLRLTATCIPKPNIIKPTNEEYGISNRNYIPTHNKAIDEIDLSQINDPHLKLSIEAQKLFGLRREESLKIILSQADQGNFLEMQPSWTKGAVPRQIPIETPEQRAFIDRAKSFVGEGRSFIPADKSNREQLNRYIGETKRIGFRNLHGLRHAYAQRRYRELRQYTGKILECPLRGGKSRKEMAKEERLIDDKIRERISANLGHSRISIVKIYIG
ncbi:MAG: integrase [Gammaproteobacteria bacterium]|jgi:hypothetical protein|nr:integrase [Gammaproteobacteria bacterium]